MQTRSGESFSSHLSSLEQTMNWVIHANTIGGSPLPIPQPSYLHPPSPPPPLVVNSGLGNRISPSILLIIVILAVIFFISGLLHLLVRCLLRPTSRDPEEIGSATAMQGQLQQLFHLHDAGVDQSFIDTLPIFLYKAIIGLKDPFDCAVCLCEFEGDDKLRLLPKCSHAFHIECIDTWLLSHSTCPLCRRSLLPDYSPGNSCFSPVVLVLESAGSESSREIVGPDRGEPNSYLGLSEDELAPAIHNMGTKEELPISAETPEAKVVAVKLGKFRNVDVGGVRGEASSIAGSEDSKLEFDQRRCHSMGSYEYVMDETSQLQVFIRPTKKKLSTKKPKHRLAMSECDCQSRRGFKGFDPTRNSAARGNDGDARITSKRESFSVSKIWLRSKRRMITEDCSRRALSFRLPVLHRQSCDSSRAAPELAVAPRWEKSGSETDVDVETGSCNNSIGSLAEETPSFARRTLLWIVGRQNKVGDYI